MGNCRVGYKGIFQSPVTCGFKHSWYIGSQHRLLLGIDFGKSAAMYIESLAEAAQKAFNFFMSFSRLFHKQ